MRLLADENADVQWIQALDEGGHDIVRVTTTAGLDAGVSDRSVLDWATTNGRVLLTADQSDFSDPPQDDHAGVIIVADVSRSGGEVRRGADRIDQSGYDLTCRVAFLSDWL